MKQSTIKLLEAIAEKTMQVRRSNHCSREQIYDAMDALHYLYGLSGDNVFGSY